MQLYPAFIIHMLQGGLTDLWLDDPYVLAAKKLIAWATEANEAGEVFPVSTFFYLCHVQSLCDICLGTVSMSACCQA